MKQTIIPGFTSDLTPKDKPSVCVFAQENSGTTRFGTTLPEPIGWIPLDKNSLRTANEYKLAGDLEIFIPDKPMVDNSAERKIAALDSTKKDELDKIRQTYADIIKRIDDAIAQLAASSHIQSIVIDKASQYFDMVTFAHFGRKNQIKPTSRGAANQDCIDLINSLGSKNSLLICKAAEIWKDTGKVDKDGDPIQAPSGKFSPSGFKMIGGFVSATLELRASHDRVKVDLDEDGDDYDENRTKALDTKYRVHVWKCKGNPLLEGQDLGKNYSICGETITWPNVMKTLKIR